MFLFESTEKTEEGGAGHLYPDGWGSLERGEERNKKKTNPPKKTCVFFLRVLADCLSPPTRAKRKRWAGSGVSNKRAKVCAVPSSYIEQLCGAREDERSPGAIIERKKKEYIEGASSVKRVF